MTAEEVVRLLGMRGHPEGGWYVETWRAGETVPRTGLPARYDGARSLSTAILYLLDAASVSVLHRVASDEVFHHYAGAPGEMLQIGPDGTASRFRLGSDLRAGERPQVVVPAGTWQGCRVVQGGAWTLLGCTVAPGFEFADFELGRRGTLRASWPHLAADIEAFTRPEAQG